MTICTYRGSIVDARYLDTIAFILEAMYVAVVQQTILQLDYDLTVKLTVSLTVRLQV